MPTETLYVLQDMRRGRYLMKQPGFLDWTTSPYIACKFTMAEAAFFRDTLHRLANIRLTILSENHLPFLGE